MTSTLSLTFSGWWTGGCLLEMLDEFTDDDGLTLSSVVICNEKLRAELEVLDLRFVRVRIQICITKTFHVCRVVKLDMFW